MLELTSVSVSFRGNLVPALSNFTFKFLPGILYGILAPSGSGKTTLLRTIAGLQSCQGRVVLEKQVMWRQPGRCALVPQRPPLLPWATVSENLSWAARIGGVRSAVSIESAISDFRLEPHLHRLPKELSGGWRHMVAFAMVSCVAPKVLLLDEPLSGVDVIRREKIWKRISKKREVNSVKILVTHDTVEAAEICDRVLVCKGPPLKILKEIDCSSSRGTPSCASTIKEILELEWRDEVPGL
ncbi:ABC transporter ATP-binding protein [Paracoccus sp. CPCC 101403]|uniref:ABC transporter ATP-binding protein n=1 Tax=Paracoccus broussonetiae TaxID=3075834 RepID=A0ABU3EKA4_9RHOB|nr:ABC transporter ATP-binding protein [Paracoccus sp. CPCC 101403]MDT1064658.1 ABC transporter ATP-binding protein [Paracoccus sp. CPCC 101403]